ncbi:hypothetical protein ARTHROSP310_37180 [Arthrobacter sp. AD-310]
MEGPILSWYLVDFYGCLLVKLRRFVMPVGAQRLERRFDCTRMVAAEKQLTAGGLEYNPDICLGSATIATVEGVKCAVCHCCCHIGLLSRSVRLYNQYSYLNHRKDGASSLCAYPKGSVKIGPHAGGICGVARSTAGPRCGKRRSGPGPTTLEGALLGARFIPKEFNTRGTKF